jgi:broad specificity phosphatase PhoE
MTYSPDQLPEIRLILPAKVVTPDGERIIDGTLDDSIGSKTELRDNAIARGVFLRRELGPGVRYERSSSKRALQTLGLIGAGLGMAETARLQATRTVELLHDQEPGESYIDVARRGFDYLGEHAERMRDEHYDQVVAIAERGLVASLVGWLSTWDEALVSMRREAMSPLSQTRLVYNGATWKVAEIATPLKLPLDSQG